MRDEQIFVKDINVPRKEQINKCECTCDECGAECEPFWKKENKEQIIIDDCKIEECVNFRDEVSIDSTVLKNACSIGLWQRHYKNLEESCKMSCKCDENPNCYFKQQARKTQIIDEVEEAIKPYQEQIELDALSLPIAIESILERKTQECEELRVAYNKAQDILGRVNGANELKSYSLQESIKECDRYRNALEAIEKECKFVIDNRECYDLREADRCELILNIINKIKEQ